MTPRYYRIRLVKDGPPTGLKIYYGGPMDPLTGEELDRSRRWQCWLNGELQENIAQFLLHYEPDGTPVIKGDEVDEIDYLLYLQRREYALLYDATAPEYDLKKPVNLRAMAPILPP